MKNFAYSLPTFPIHLAQDPIVALATIIWSTDSMGYWEGVKSVDGWGAVSTNELTDCIGGVGWGGVGWAGWERC